MGATANAAAAAAGRMFTRMGADRVSLALPEPVKACPAWLCYRTGPADPATGKFGKVPYYVSGHKRHGRQGSPEDRAQLATFPDAIKAALSGTYAGVGLALLPGCGIVAGDFDNCLTGRAIPPDLKAKIGDTYTEKSPSGRGLRCFWTGDARSWKDRAAGVEIFGDSGFVTVTGDVVLPGDAGPVPGWVLSRPLHAGQRPAAAAANVPAETVEELRSALLAMRADDYGLWVGMGHALKELGDIGRGLWLTWSATSEKFDPADAARRWESFAGDHTGFQAVFAEAQRHGWANPRAGKGMSKAKPKPGPDSSPPGEAGAQRARRPSDGQGERTHHQIATAWLETRQPPGPVAAGGALWEYADGVYSQTPRARIEADIGSRFPDEAKCKTKPHYRQIADHAEDLVADPEFFESAPVGLNTPDGFFAPTARGIERRDLSPELRQRLMLRAVPADIPTPRFDEFLDATFAEPDQERTMAQQALLQETVGAALVGCLHRFERAVYLHGKARAGKSTVLRLIEAACPPEVIGSVPPDDWAEDYHRAELANLRINLVGELPKDKPIPAAEFKAVLGRDRISGRHPYGRPFSFRPSCAHFFNSNHWICTRDQHPAFFDRWLLIHFPNTVPDAERDPELARRIVRDELPGVLHWALLGATRLLQRGHFAPGPVHLETLDKWRNSADSVAAFLAERTTRDPGATVPRAELFDRYADYCAAEERRPCGRASFYERVEGAGVLAVKNPAGDRCFRGIALRPDGFGS